MRRTPFSSRYLKVDGKTVSTNRYYFRPFKEMAFTKAEIKTAVSPTGERFKITLTSDRVARAVQLSGFADGFFADNYFDLLPGKTLEVVYRPDRKMTIDEFRNSLRVCSLIDAFN